MEFGRVNAKVELDVKKTSQILAMKNGQDFQSYVNDALIRHNEFKKNKIENDKILDEEN